jgi:hypothetical protein
VTADAARATVAHPADVTCCSHSANGDPARSLAAIASRAPSSGASAPASRAIFASFPLSPAAASSASATSR